MPPPEVTAIGADSTPSARAVGVVRLTQPPGNNPDSLPSPPDTFYARRGKRLLELAVAAAALVATLPLQAGIALAVRPTLGRPVLFRQSRPGLDEVPFTLVKFRTMTDECDTEGRLRPDAVRLTRFGRFLRASSLDELPELLNVIRGDMSLVGPRPLLVRYLPHYSARERERHAVRPGLTGLAQVSGRNALAWEERFSLDVEYVEHVSLRLDLRILVRTLVKVWRRADISADGYVTMPPFATDQPT